MWLDRIDGGDKIFYTTGRLTSEMVIKAAQMGIPFLVSRSGLTQMGHEIAEKVGITMIGRATGKHYLLFTGARALPLERLTQRDDALARADVTGIVLAGGQGRRMGGVDKGLVELGGEPMVAHVLARLAPQVGDVLINANQNLERYRAFGHPVVADARRRLRRAARRPARRADAARRARSSSPCPAIRRSCRRISSRACRRRSTRTTRSSPSRRPSTSRIRCSRWCAATCCRTSPRFSTAADARSTRGTRRSPSSRSRFDDEADAFRNINTADELAAAAKRVSSVSLRTPGSAIESPMHLRTAADRR